MPTPIKAPEIIYSLLSNNSNVSGIISIISNKIRDEKAMPIEKQITFLLPLFILLITTPIRKNKPAINVNNNSFICFSF